MTTELRNLLSLKSFLFLYHCRKIGHEHSDDDDKCTKPKHHIIADAYAKRMDDVISVSIENSHTDPAGLNIHDVNNLNSAESEAMGATLTNYLCNIINRRNAITTAAPDFIEPNMHCASYASSCSDNDSKSKISQVSTVKISESKNLGRHSKRQNIFELGRKIRRKRNYLYSSVQKTPRASSSSVDSHDSLQSARKYKYRTNRTQINANADTIQDFSRCVLKHRDRVSALDDDNSIDQCENVHVSHEDQAIIKQAVKNLLKKSIEKEIEQLLNNCDHNRLNRKSGRSSVRNSKSKRHYPSQKTNEVFTAEKTNDLDVAMSSSIDIYTIHRLGGTRSSISDQSVNRMKTQSQNSKESCDVGIQVGIDDIESHTTQFSHDDCERDSLPEKIQSNHHNQDDESHQLLPFRRQDTQSICKDTLSSKHLSDSEKVEKLKKLLLPSS